MIEAAQVAARWDPALKAWHQRLTKRKGYGTATAALARKLVVAVYHILKEEKDYHPTSRKIYKLKKATLGKPVPAMVNPA